MAKHSHAFLSPDLRFELQRQKFCEEKRLDISSVQLLSRVRLFVTPWTAACQASLSITNSRSLQTMSIESVMPSNHLILYWPLLLPPSIFPSIRVFSNESVLQFCCKRPLIIFLPWKISIMKHKMSRESYLHSLTHWLFLCAHLWPRAMPGPRIQQWQVRCSCFGEWTFCGVGISRS